MARDKNESLNLLKQSSTKNSLILHLPVDATDELDEVSKIGRWDRGRMQKEVASYQPKSDKGWIPENIKCTDINVQT